ncbi:metallophosphoesterase family protein [Marinivivus vitaminiproducens]|uniref:metallophosphoesterase family protein n=1 Tax=Marinivivus vitaminiproducens TaxID=3035935 RepID=UPI00279CFFA5|nr:metallophosphoesterase [Geminicoccaceae bacterium SCSIO 64248]
MFTLAHLSDPHLPPPASIPTRALLGKRFMGYLSYRVKRRDLHSDAVLAALVADLKARHADHIAVTGDLTTLGLPAEFAAARDWLAALGPADRVSAVPGNHDALVAVPWPDGVGRWRAFMQSDVGAAPTGDEQAWPFVRARPPVALVGVSSACPTPPGSAAGRVGPRQLVRLCEALATLRAQGLFRVIMIHHPPIHDAASARKRLLDARAFARAIAQEGAELILHGHNHTSVIDELAGPDGGVPVIGVTSASAGPGHAKGGARYHLYDIAQAGADWTVTTRVRAIAPDGQGCVDVPGFGFTLPRPDLSPADARRAS